MEKKPTGIKSFKNTELKQPTTHKPFSNGTDASYFLDTNCYLCKKCKEDLATPDDFADNECPMYIEIYAGFMTGEISTESARKIGMLEADYKGKCLEFQPENPAFKADVKPIKVNAMNQTTLF